MVLINHSKSLFSLFYYCIYGIEVSKQIPILSMIYLWHVIPLLADLIDLQTPSSKINQTDTTHHAYKEDK